MPSTIGLTGKVILQPCGELKDTGMQPYGAPDLYSPPYVHVDIESPPLQNMIKHASVLSVTEVPGELRDAVGGSEARANLRT